MIIVYREKRDITFAEMLFLWVLSAISTLAIQLNSLICAMFICYHKQLLASTQNRILCSMALGDCFVGVFGVNLAVLLLLKKEEIYYKLFGNIPIFSSLFVSILSLILLTVDRLIAMKKPYLYTSLRYKKIVSKIIVLAWIIPALIILQQSLLYIDNKIGFSNELKTRSFLFAIFFIFGAIVLVWSNSLLFLGIRAHIKSVSESRLRRQKSGLGSSVRHAQNNGRDSRTAAYVHEEGDIELTQHPFPKQFPTTNRRISPYNMPNRVRRRLTREQELKITPILCLLISVVFILATLPLAAYRFLYAIGMEINIPWLRRFSLCLTVANSLLNPLLYLLVRKEFRAYLKILMLKLCCY